MIIYCSLLFFLISWFRHLWCLFIHRFWLFLLFVLVGWTSNLLGSLVGLLKNLQRFDLFSFQDYLLQGLFRYDAFIPVVFLDFKALKKLEKLNFLFSVIFSSVFVFFWSSLSVSFIVLFLLTIFLINFNLLLHQKLLLLFSLKPFARFKILV